MKASYSLAFFAALTGVIAGPVKHAKLHHRHAHAQLDTSNSTTAALVLGTGNIGSAIISASSTPAASPSTAAGGTITGYGDKTETQTKTITATTTITVGSGENAVTSVVTQIQYEVLEVIIKYVIDYVTDQVTVTAPNAAGKGAAQAAAITTPTGLAALQGDAHGNSAPVAPNNPLVTPTAEESSSPTDDGSDDDDDDDDTVTEVVVTTVTSVGPDSTVVQIVYADATVAASSTGADGTAVPVNGVNYPKTKKHRTRHRSRTRTRTKSKSKSSSATASASASAATVAAPATTGAGTVSGCTQWYVAKSGDYCSLVAGNYGISTETFESWNPSVGSDCRTMYAGWAYCVATLANATTPASFTTSASASASAAGTSFPANYPINKSSTMATSASPSQQSSAQTTAATSAAASAATNAAQPLGPTGAGTVAGCTQWYTAVSGDYCSKIAGEFGISTSTFIAWNPSVGSSCLTLYAGYSYCVAAPSSGATSAPASANQQPTSAATSGYASAPTGGSSSSGGSTTPSGDYSYQFYQGDGTTAQGWPAMSDWVDFDTMWTFNLPIMSQSCTQFGTANNSPDESADIKSAIQQVSSSSGVDPRFILAIIMQESNGCVRVPTTSWSVLNPGLMQDFNGPHTCYPHGGSPVSPCPMSEIVGMIQDGTEGTPNNGLVQDLAAAGSTDVSMYYKAARIYNGGTASYNPNNLGSGCCTLCYASDIANRLRGWHTGPSTCTLGTA